MNIFGDSPLPRPYGGDERDEALWRSMESDSEDEDTTLLLKDEDSLRAAKKKKEKKASKQRRSKAGSARRLAASEEVLFDEDYVDAFNDAASSKPLRRQVVLKGLAPLPSESDEYRAVDDDNDFSRLVQRAREQFSSHDEASAEGREPPLHDS